MHPIWLLPERITGTKLVDLADYRLSLMDEAGVDYAVLSVTSPGAEQFAIEVGKNVAQDANDLLFEVTKKYPDRFGGFASLAPKDPEWSAQELERCVKELGFKGWKTHSNYAGSYLDDKRYWPILAKAEELGAAVYLHPRCRTSPNFCDFGSARPVRAFGFGTATDLLAIMRMIVRGVFDAIPKLKIILGHLGEGLPFLVAPDDRACDADRTSRPPRRPDRPQGSKQPASIPTREHRWVSTSGNYLPAAFVVHPRSYRHGQDPVGHRLSLREHEGLHGLSPRSALDRRRSVRTVRGQRKGPRLLIPSILGWGRCGKARKPSAPFLKASAAMRPIYRSARSLLR